MTDSRPAVTAFRALHASGCFVMPNPWDAGSAVFLQSLGFPALASTSAGFAFSRARPDAADALDREEVLAHLRELVAATPLPVNADYQSGYADELDGLAASVRACVATGVAGLSIEDATGDASSPLFDTATAVARVRAARAAIDATGVPVVLTARCEAWLVRHPDAERIVLDRLPAFAEAGADCLFAPGVRDTAKITALVRAVAPKPLNVLVSAPGPGLSVAQLEGVGVRRISTGSALARVAWSAFMDAARGIAEQGSFAGLAGATPMRTLDALFTRRA